MEEFPAIQHLKLDNNTRILAYAIYGDTTAVDKTIFYFHGFPSSRDEALVYSAAAREHGIRLVSVDRPGLGGSTFQHDRRIADWADDIASLADALHVPTADTYGVLGVSGGAPYALVCAGSARCAAVGTVCGLYPTTRFGYGGMLVITRVAFTVAQWSTWLVAKVLELAVSTDPVKARNAFENSLGGRSRRDYEAWCMYPELRKGLVGGVVGALDAGGRGSAWEAYLFGRDWGFELEDINIAPGKLVMWYGAIDVNIPVDMARKAAGFIKNAEVRVSPGESHLSMMVETRDEVMKTMSDILSSK